MRVNGFLARVSGTTIIKLYDRDHEFLPAISVNDYFDKGYDEQFADYDFKTIGVKDGILYIYIRPADKSQFAELIGDLRDQLESLSVSLGNFEEDYL